MESQTIKTSSGNAAAEWTALGAVVGIALVLHIATFRFHPVIEGDGIEYAGLARLILIQHDLAGGLTAYRASLYQYLMAGVAVFTEDIHLAGKIVSAAFGALLLAPLFFLAKRLFGVTVAWVTVLLALTHQVLLNYSGMLFTESSLLFFLWSGLLAGWLTLSSARPLYAVTAGLLLGVGAAFHPQGTVYILIPLLLLFLQCMKPPGGQGQRRQVTAFTSLILGFALVYGAFNWAVGQASGGVPLGGKLLPNLVYGEDMDASNPQRTVSQLWKLDENGSTLALDAKISATSVAQYVLQHPGQLISRAYRNLGKLDRETLLNAIRPSQVSGSQALFAALVVLGLFGAPWRRQEAKAQVYLALIVACNILSNAFFFFHERLIVPVLPAFLIWAALGVVRLGHWVTATAQNLWPQHTRISRLSVYAGWTALLLLCGVFTLNYFRLQPELIDHQLAHQRDVGLWMQENLPQDATLMTDNPFTPYYYYKGVQKFVMTPYAPYEQFMTYARSKDVDYVFLSEWVTTAWEFPIRDLLESGVSHEGLDLVHEWTFQDGKRARLFALHRP